MNGRRFRHPNLLNPVNGAHVAERSSPRVQPTRDAELQSPAPVDADTSVSATVDAGIGALEAEDLAADALDQAPAGSDVSAGRAVQALRNARPEQRKRDPRQNE